MARRVEGKELHSLEMERPRNSSIRPTAPAMGALRVKNSLDEGFTLAVLGSKHVPSSGEERRCMSGTASVRMGIMHAPTVANDHLEGQDSRTQWTSAAQRLTLPEALGC